MKNLKFKIIKAALPMSQGNICQGNQPKKNETHSSDKHSFDFSIALLLASLLLCALALNSGAQTTVLFPLAQMTGTTNDTTITIRPVNNPVKFNSQIYWLPPAGIQLPTKNGSATTNLIPNDYNITIAGVPGSWKISVADTNITLNAAEIGNLTTYTFTDLFGYVKRIIPGTGISISPAGGQGNVTINSTGGGGGGGSATNAYQTQAGNKLITITTNLTDLIYTISGVSQTNGYPWGVLYDAAGTALTATNGISLTSGLAAFRGTNSFDAAGRATAATNGYPWGSLYDAAGAAQSATNGLSLPSGLAAFRGTNTFAATNVATTGAVGLVKPDGTTITIATDGTISAATGGSGDVSGPASATDGNFSLFDGTSGKLLKNSAVSPASFDAAGSASAVTNGYPWGALYDATGAAIAATNGISLASGLAAFRTTNSFDAAGRATAATNGYPWGVLYDSSGTALAATNGLSLTSGLSAFRSTNSFDAAGTASATTNGYPWGTLYDAAGTAVAATNGLSIASGLAAFRATNSFDAAGVATAATNGLSLASGLAAFRSTNTFAATNAATASTRGLVKVDNSSITIAADGTISATTGGGGSVTSVALTVPGEFSVSGSPVTTSGTLALTRTADADFLGLGATNVGFLKVTNFASIGGQTRLSALIVTNGFTNVALTASTLVSADANKKLTSLANGAGVLTNDASGNFGYTPLLDASALKASQYAATDGSTNLVSTQNGNNWTNTIPWTHEGTTTNLVATFNGTLQTFTVTNGPDVFLSYAGANGSVSYRFTTNVTLHFTYQPKWLVGSNSVITNGVLSFTSYGGTNATQLEAAMKENQ